MKLVTVSIILFLGLTKSASAQELKTVKIKHPVPANITEKFQVLKDNPTIKNGSYVKSKGWSMIESGFFRNNIKDSVWKIYTLKGKLIATGNYSSDNKTGVWSYYTTSGALVQKYDHDKDTLIYFNLTEEKKFGHAPNVYPDTALEQMPIFIGGTSYMNALIQNNITYPKAAWSKKRTASIYVSFVIDTTGNTVNVKSITQAGDGFDEEGVRVIELFGRAWIPGIQKGKKVKVQYKIPLTFTLQ